MVKKEKEIMTKKSKMTNLISLVALLVAVIVVFFIVEKVNKDNELKEAKESEETSEITLSSTQADKIVSFSYRYDGTEYEFYKENDIWYCVNDTEIELDQDIMNDFTQNFVEVTASRMVDEEVSDLSQYGLDNPANVIKFTDTDANTITYDIGNENQTVNGYYIKKEDENTVYLADTFPNLFEKTLDDLKKVEDDSTTTDTSTQE